MSETYKVELSYTKNCIILGNRTVHSQEVWPYAPALTLYDVAEILNTETAPLHQRIAELEALLSVAFMLCEGDEEEKLLTLLDMHYHRTPFSEIREKFVALQGIVPATGESAGNAETDGE